MTPKVSIIVPIYNAGKFLEKCLDTLVNQTLKDIEIILVLDCPTDGSDRIAREYTEKDPRIRLIVNEQNLNIGLSRNEGLKIAVVICTIRSVSYHIPMQKARGFQKNFQLWARFSGRQSTPPGCSASRQNGCRKHTGEELTRRT